MKTRKPVLRSCCLSKEVLEKKDLLRIVRTPDGTVVIDPIGKVNGRGAYLKKDKDIILKAQKVRILDKKLEVEVPDEIYIKLLEYVE